MERATHTDRPDLQRILLKDMKQQMARMDEIIVRQRRLPTLVGDRADVERCSLKLEHEAVRETADIIAILRARLSVTT